MNNSPFTQINNKTTSFIKFYRVIKLIHLQKTNNCISLGYEWMNECVGEYTQNHKTKNKLNWVNMHKRRHKHISFLDTSIQSQ